MWARRNKRGMLADYRWAGCLTCHVPHSARLNIPQQQQTDTLLFLFLLRLRQILFLLPHQLSSQILSQDTLLLHSGPHSFPFSPLSSSYPLFPFIFIHQSSSQSFYPLISQAACFLYFHLHCFSLESNHQPHQMQGRCAAIYSP